MSLSHKKFLFGKFPMSFHVICGLPPPFIKNPGNANVHICITVLFILIPNFLKIVFYLKRLKSYNLQFFFMLYFIILSRKFGCAFALRKTPLRKLRWTFGNICVHCSPPSIVLFSTVAILRICYVCFYPVK